MRDVHDFSTGSFFDSLNELLRSFLDDILGSFDVFFGRFVVVDGYVGDCNLDAFFDFHGCLRCRLLMTAFTMSPFNGCGAPTYPVALPIFKSFIIFIRLHIPVGGAEEMREVSCTGDWMYGTKHLPTFCNYPHTLESKVATRSIMPSAVVFQVVAVMVGGGDK